MLILSDRSKIALATPEPPSRLINYDSVASHPDVDWRGQLPYPYYPQDLENIDAIIVSDEWAPGVRACIAACKLKGIPTFHVLDGVIRWKNLFENPRSLVPENGSPFMRPLMSDMTFVMGDLQAAVLRWLGNSMICVSGLPRFANYELKVAPTENIRIPAFSWPQPIDRGTQKLSEIFSFRLFSACWTC